MANVEFTNKLIAFCNDIQIKYPEYTSSYLKGVFGGDTTAQKQIVEKRIAIKELKLPLSKHQISKLFKETKLVAKIHYGKNANAWNYYIHKNVGFNLKEWIAMELNKGV